MNDQQGVESSERPGPDAGGPPAAGGKSRKDRYIKLGFLAAGLIVVGWLVLRQYFGVDLPGWDTDLEAALKLAAEQDRSILLVAHDRPTGYDFGRLKEILGRPANKKAMVNANVIKISAYLDRDGQWWRKYKIKAYPTMLLLGPDGRKIAEHQGYLAETLFPPFVYQAVLLKGWQTDLAAAQAEAKEKKKNLLVVLYEEPAGYTFGMLKVMLNQSACAEAAEKAGVVKVAVKWNPKGPLAAIVDGEKTAFPVMLLLSSDGSEAARREAGAIIEFSAEKDFEKFEEDFRDNFLREKAPD